jgi:hypothetical protein
LENAIPGVFEEENSQYFSMRFKKSWQKEATSKYLRASYGILSIIYVAF